VPDILLPNGDTVTVEVGDVVVVRDWGGDEFRMKVTALEGALTKGGEPSAYGDRITGHVYEGRRDGVDIVGPQRTLPLYAEVGGAAIGLLPNKKTPSRRRAR